MPRDTRDALVLLGEFIYARRASDSDAFRGLLPEGIQGIGVTVVEERLFDWL